MNKVILCEGKTDAVLLSYYLNKVCGFEVDKGKVTNQLTLGQNKGNESFSWYRKNNDYLGIWGIGGKNCFKKAISEFFNVLKKSPDTMNYDAIAIVCDRDLEINDAIVLSEFSGFFAEANMIFENNQIRNGDYYNSFGEKRIISTFALIIPQERFGALETVLLEALKGNDYDRKIVEKSDYFVNEIRGDAAQYIKTDRLVLKAKLSTVFAIMTPEKVFSFIDELLVTTVKWEEKEYLNELFGELVEFINQGDI